MRVIKSVWVIKLKNGGIFALTEENYEALFNGEKSDVVECEEHWFDIDKAKEKYPNVNFS